MPTTTLVTGAAGFIGAHLVEALLRRDPEARVVGLDKLTYAANPETVTALTREPRFRLIVGDVADGALLRALLAEVRPDAVLHLAAESHVDRSIAGPADFVHTNVVGTFALVDALREALPALPAAFRLVHVSTDEVYGELGATGAFTEASPYRPSSPYAASKAASDHLVAAYHRTYGLPALITHGTNNYGPYQHPEKLIPHMIGQALAGAPLPVYGRGDNVRDWLHVTDHVAALLAVLDRGQPGARYLIGARCERTNLEVVGALCDVLDALAPRASGRHADAITRVADRPGHDHRYALDPTRLEAELGWRPAVPFDAGLHATVAWYLAHPAWVTAARTAR